MGSGSSKEKAPPQKKALNIQNEKKQPPLADSRSREQGGTNNSHGTRLVGNTQVTQNNKQEWTSSRHNNSAANINNNQTKRTVPAKSFDSDSDSEDDIAAVLEATKNEYNNKLQEQRLYQDNNNQTSYPESYAQRLQREQYKHEPQGLMRQKTIYRNPEEWEATDVGIV